MIVPGRGRIARRSRLLHDASRKSKIMLIAQEKPILHVPYVVGRGEGCLLPDAVSEIRCRRAKKIPGSKVFQGYVLTK